MKCHLLALLLIASGRLAAAPQVALIRPAPLPEKEVELRALRNVLREDPNNLSLAVYVAWKLVDKSRLEGTPQPLSHAIAALTPWWSSREPHPEVLLLRATIRQSLHEFPCALEDLDLLVKTCPAHPQAWLTRATVQLVSGDLDASAKSCRVLQRLSSPLVFAAALTAVETLQRDTPEAAELERLLSAKPADPPAVQSWASAILADHLARWDHRQRADEWFREGLALTPDDRSLLAARADFFLTEGMYREVKTLLESRTSDDLLLLRLAMAVRALHDPATVYTNILKEHSATARELGVSLHLREEALLHLNLLDDPKGSFQLAVKNWQMQKEAQDALLLLRASAAAGDDGAAKPVLAWLTAQKVTAPDLVKAAAALHFPTNSMR